MGLFSHRVKLPPNANIEIAKAEAQRKKSEEDVKEAESLMKDLASIREDNHFVRDWRKALGVKDGR